VDTFDPGIRIVLLCSDSQPQPVRRRRSSALAPERIPRTYVIDRHGIIVYQGLGFEPHAAGEVDRAIQKALAQT
jgi:hypothetical protein